MIQRIQSLYLLIAAAAMGSMFFFPLADAIGSDDSLILYAYKIKSLVPDYVPDIPSYFIWPIAGLTAMVFILAVVTIFLYGNRLHQLKVIRISIIMLIVLIALFFFYYSPEMEKISGGLTGYRVPGAYLPVGALVFFILAYRAIVSDERLIRSADRLR